MPTDSADDGRTSTVGAIIGGAAGVTGGGAGTSTRRSLEPRNRSMRDSRFLRIRIRSSSSTDNSSTGRLSLIMMFSRYCKNLSFKKPAHRRHIEGQIAKGCHYWIFQSM